MRIAVAQDVSAIAGLIESAYRGDVSRQGWTTEAALFAGNRTSVSEVSSLLAEQDTRFVVAIEGSCLVGCAVIRNESGIGYFGMFAVSPTLQGEGLGKQILFFAEKMARELWSCQSMSMTVISIREELIAFYLRRGYRATGEKPFPFDKEPNARRRDFHFVVLSKSLAY